MQGYGYYGPSTSNTCMIYNYMDTDINKLHVDLRIFVYKHEVANTAYPGLPRIYSSIFIIIIVVIIITLKIIVVFIFLA